MKFLHLADLHFGKSIHGVSLVENGDQPAWAERFLKLAEELRPDAVVMAGDIYNLFHFLTLRSHVVLLLW